MSVVGVLPSGFRPIAWAMLNLQFLFLLMPLLRPSSGLFYQVVLFAAVFSTFTIPVWVVIAGVTVLIALSKGSKPTIAEWVLLVIMLLDAAWFVGFFWRSV